jgi:hypothetical protein
MDRELNENCWLVFENDNCSVPFEYIGTETKLSDLIGKTISNVSSASENHPYTTLHCSDGSIFKIFHELTDDLTEENKDLVAITSTKLFRNDI